MCKKYTIKGGKMIYLVRHGLDDESRIGGYSDVGLTKEGIKQVEDARNFVETLSFNDIVSSDILRAKQTADIINKNMNKKTIYTDELTELNKGNYNGVLKSSLPKDDYFLGNVKIYDCYPNGESLLDMYFRIEKLMLTVDKWDNNLLVTHRGVINMMYYLLNNKKPDMNKDSWGVTHASVHKLDLKRKTIERIY